MQITLDILGAILSLACTFLLVRLNPWGWPLGLLSNIINTALFMGTRLYADSVIEVYFFISTAYGWYYWLKTRKTSNERTVHRLNTNQHITLAGITATLGLVGFIALRTTDSTTPGLDSLGASLSITAQWLIARKYLETWYLWIAADLVYALVYAIKGLPFHMALMASYMILGVQGIKHWQALSADEPDPISHEMHPEP